MELFFIILIVWSGLVTLWIALHELNSYLDDKIKKLEEKQ